MNINQNNDPAEAASADLSILCLGTGPGLHPVIHRLDLPQTMRGILLAVGTNSSVGVQARRSPVPRPRMYLNSPAMGCLHPHQGAHFQRAMSLLFMKEPALWHQGFIKAADS